MLYQEIETLTLGLGLILSFMLLFLRFYNLCSYIRAVSLDLSLNKGLVMALLM